MRVALAAAVLCFVTAAWGAQQKQEDVADAMSEVAGELQECSAYFLLSSSCVGDQYPDLSKTYRQLSDQVGMLALRGLRARGLSPEAYAAHASELLADMQKATENSCANVAVLLRKYAKFCAEIARDTDARLKQWMACKRAKRAPCPGGPL
jgi:hypothetical protein